MRAQRVLIIIPAILTFGFAGSILVSPAIASAATSTPAVHAHHTGPTFVSKPCTYYHA
jgi:hypothetical protein